MPSFSVDPVGEGVRAASVGRPPWLNLVLFAATVVSTFVAGAQLVDGSRSPLRGWVFALPLLAILVTHELGHYVQARRHRVDASLPYFIPFPLPPLGTLGAVISMRGRIRTRDALLDIGAWGPLAGLVVALPVLAIGLRLSNVEPIPEHGSDEGQSLLYLALKRIVLGPIPTGYDVFLHPVAFAGWAGLFMTMLNLLPIAQLDGGHVAYALFGRRQNTYSRRVHHALLAVALGVGLWSAATLLLRHGPHAPHVTWSAIGWALLDGKNWAVWWVLLFALTRFSGKDHPPTDDGELSPGRKWVAWITLALFVALFMPIPFSAH